jgi:apolipoprotein N-acyltransferase
MPRLAMAIFSGLLLILSFPKFGNGMVAWLALIPLLHALRDAKPSEGFKTGFITGLIAYCGILYWVSCVIVEYGNLPIYIGMLAVLLLAAYLSLYTAFFAMALCELRKRGNSVFLWAPLLWTVLEFARSHLLTGFPWENLAYSQYLNGNIIQIADITGIYGITFAIVLVNAVIENVMTATWQRRKYPVFEIASVCVVLIAIYGYGHYRTADIGERLEKASPFEVSLIQGNIDQNLKWDARYQSQTLDIYRSLTMGAIPAHDGLIVWPETAAPFYFERDDQLRAKVIDLARLSERPILFGSPNVEEESGRVSFMNSAFFLQPDGVVVGRYDKVHLVPYGEYVPLRKFFPFMGKIVSGIGDFRPGKGFDPIEHHNRRFGILVCYEGIFPEAAREYKNKRANLLVNITNDAWFGKTSAPYQHLSMTVFRAVENRLFVIRAANTGISAIIDPTGKIISQSELFTRTILQNSVRFISCKTFYAEHGDIFVLVCALSLMCCIFIIFRRKSDACRTF